MKRTNIIIDGQEIPVKIYRERRRDVRFSFTARTGGYLRMPAHYTELQVREQEAKFEKWLREAFAKKPELIERFRGRVYEDGTTLTVGKKTYTIRFSEKENAKYHTAKIEGYTIHIIISTKDKGHHLQKSIRQLISRCVGNDRLPEMTERVRFWNDRHFNKPVNKVSFKLNQSNWGSCSTRGNINFSTRLLFAPDEVIDYVIVHELAHLIEANHSAAFWKVVSDVMPDYKEKEDWLKQHGEACNF